MMEEDDPIVEEVQYTNIYPWAGKIIIATFDFLQIPVYLSKSLANNLYVIQFPIKNNLYNINRSNITNCCFKPESKQVSSSLS